MIIEIEANCYNCIFAHIDVDDVYCDITDGELVGLCEEYEPVFDFKPDDLKNDLVFDYNFEEL